MSRRVYVVLGAAVRPGGRPSPALRRRIEHAVALVRRDPDARLLLTGGVGDHPPSEADVMAAIAKEGGVARERLMLEPLATTTAESARLSAALLREAGCDDLWIVTDAYHQRRARLAFRRAGFAARSASPPDTVGVGLRTRARRTLREWVGLVWYGLTFRG